jgi:RimJ/RimL family protein N-acetyltransferase
VVSLIHVSNARSQALARRLGMTPGDETLHAGMPHVIWSIAREAWS